MDKNINMKTLVLPVALVLVLLMSGCSSSSSGQSQNQNQMPTPEGTNCGSDMGCMVPLSETCSKAYATINIGGDSSMFIQIKGVEAGQCVTYYRMVSGPMSQTGQVVDAECRYAPINGKYVNMSISKSHCTGLLAQANQAA